MDQNKATKPSPDERQTLPVPPGCVIYTGVDDPTQKNVIRLSSIDAAWNMPNQNCTVIVTGGVAIRVREPLYEVAEDLFREAGR